MARGAGIGAFLGEWCSNHRCPHTGRSQAIIGTGIHVALHGVAGSYACQEASYPETLRCFNVLSVDDV
jgi:hypothetical protein